MDPVVFRLLDGLSHVRVCINVKHAPDLIVGPASASPLVSQLVLLRLDCFVDKRHRHAMERINRDQETVPKLPPPRQQVAFFGSCSLSEDKYLPPSSYIPRTARCPGWTGCQWATTASDATAAANSWWERIGIAPYLPSRYRLPIASCLRGSRSARG